MPPICGCRNHGSYSEGTNFSVFKVSGLKFTKAVIASLVERELLSPRATYLCTACALFAESNFLDVSGPKRRLYSRHYVDAVISAIEDGSIDTHDLLRLTAAIGSSQSFTLYEESVRQSQGYKDDACLTGYSAVVWLIGSMSPRVLSDGTLGTVRYIGGYPGVLDGMSESTLPCPTVPWFSAS